MPATRGVSAHWSGTAAQARQRGMNISAPFIARPIATWLLAIAVLLAGVLGYRALPVSALPTVDFPTIQVTTQLPGAGPDTVATLITASPRTPVRPDHRACSSMTSTSSEGTSQITLQFNLSRKMDSAAQDVQAAINAAAGTLPDTLPYPPVYAKVNPADAPIISLALTSDSITIDTVSDAADTLLQPKLSQIDGVGKVTVQGGQRPAVRVRIDPARVAAYGLSHGGRPHRRRRRQRQRRQGRLRRPRARPTRSAPTTSSLTPDAYRNLVIAYRNGAPVRLSDVGTVVGGVENDRVAGWYNGQPAVVLDIQRQPGANIVSTVAAIKAALPALQRAIPAAVTHAGRHRPHRDHPRLGRRRAVHPRPLHRPGGLRHLPLPAQRPRHPHPRHRPAALPHRHLRRHGPAAATASTTSASWRSPSPPASSSTTPSS